MPPIKLALLSIAASVGLGLAQPATAQSVAGIDVTGRRATVEIVPVRGLSDRSVRQVVRIAAGHVCRNAVFNHELDTFDQDWCASRTMDRTLGEFRALKRSGASQLAWANLTITAD